MQITVRLFALLRTREGSATITLDLPNEASAALLIERFFDDRPTLAPLRPHLRLALNGALVARDADLASLHLAQGDEVGLLPPASGGSSGSGADGEDADAAGHDLAAALTVVPGGRRIARILSAPLDEQLERRLAAQLQSDSDGAIVSFVGRTRVTPGTPAPGEEVTAARFAGERVIALEYEVAPVLAERVLAAICDRLLAAGGGALGGIGVVHAEGVVPLGGVSLVAVVAAPHRAAAYAASVQLIDELKREAPIWKLERFASGAIWSANPDALR